MLNINNPNRNFIIVGILLVLVIIIAFYTLITANSVLVSPKSGDTNVNRFTKIVFTYKRAIDPNKFQVFLSPSFTFTTDFKENNTKVIIIPKYPLTSGVNYIIDLVSPVTLRSSFITEVLPQDTTTAQSNEYLESSSKIAEKNKDVLDKNQAIAIMRQKLPIETSTFSLNYVIETNLFIARLKGDDTSKSRNDLDGWLKEQRVDKTLIDIKYIDSSTPSFTILEAPFNGKSVSPNTSLTLTFSEPIKVEKSGPILDIKIDPPIQTLYNFDLGQGKLTIKPERIWLFNTKYTLTIGPKTTGVNGSTLGKDYIYTFTSTGAPDE